MLHELKKKIDNLEKYLHENLERIYTEVLKKRLSNLEKEVSQKVSKFEVSDVNEKVKVLDEFVYTNFNILDDNNYKNENNTNEGNVIEDYVFIKYRIK